MLPVPATRVRPSVAVVVGLTVLESVMSPAPLPVDSVMPDVNTIGFAKLIFAFVVVMPEPRLLVPPPD
jgi:hypothetical protein